MWGRIRNRGRIRNHRWRWKMRRGRWGCCACTPRSGTSIRTRLVCLGFRQVGICRQRSARISRSVCTRLSMPPTKKAAARTLRWLSIQDICRFPRRNGMPSKAPKKFVVRHPPNADKDLALNPDVPVTSQTPPTFLLQAEDDHVDNVDDSLAYYIAVKKAGVPVEMHLYAQGGHAFGLRRTELPITGWPQLVETWLRTIGMIPK